MKYFLVYYYGLGSIEEAHVKEFKERKEVDEFLAEEKIVGGDYCLIKGEKLLKDFDNSTLEEMFKEEVSRLLKDVNKLKKEEE